MVPYGSQAQSPSLRFPDAVHDGQPLSFLRIQIITLVRVLGENILSYTPVFITSATFGMTAAHSALPSYPVVKSFCMSTMSNILFIVSPVLPLFLYTITVKTGIHLLHPRHGITAGNDTVFR